MLIISIITGCFIGFGIACMCIGNMLSDSNDHGDSVGTLKDFDHDSFRIIDEY